MSKQISSNETLKKIEVLQQLCCWECGINFAVPSMWLENKLEEGESVKCPNGHDNCYETEDAHKKRIGIAGENETLKKKIEELKHRLFQAIHDREQSEAKGIEPVIEPLAEFSAPVLANANAPVIVKEGRIYCHLCNASFKMLPGYSRHLSKIHKRPSEEIQSLFKLACIAWENANAQEVQAQS